MGQSFVCGVCGKVHEGLPTDRGYKLPDDVWAIPEAERAAKAKFTSDLCQFGERFFIRCIILLPFTEFAGDFGWGAWVEVEQKVFDRYLELFEADASEEPRYPGTLANALPGYDVTSGKAVLVQFGSPRQRPCVHLFPDDPSQLALDQRQGVTAARYHQLLDAMGVQH